MGTTHPHTNVTLVKMFEFYNFNHKNADKFESIQVRYRTVSNDNHEIRTNLNMFKSCDDHEIEMYNNKKVCKSILLAKK